MMYVSYQGWGGDAYPGETPQYEEDHAWMHDEPDYEPGSADYNWFYGNGQLHVSPHHDHDDLRGHANVGADSTGPLALGTVSVDQGRATWSVEGNTSLRAVAKALRDYTKRVGWKWHGLTDLDGQPVDDAFAPRAAFYVAVDNDDHIHLAASAEHLASRGRVATIILAGSTAYVPRPLMRYEGLREWADDTGFRLVAEYPGGTDMTDRIYNREDLETYNLGDSSASPMPTNKDDLGTFACQNCGKKFPNFADYVQHRNAEGHRWDETLPEDASKFPELPDMDKTLPAHYHERFPVVSPLASWKEAARVPAFDDYADFWGLKDDTDFRHYAAYRGGQPCAFATVCPDGDGGASVVLVASSLPGRGYGSALLRELQSHFARLHTSSVSESGARLLYRNGFARVAGQNWKWAAGQQPKDILEQPVPFVYDVDGDTIDFGQPGQRTSDVQPAQAATFTPGGIVEGYYEPGGTITITTDTNMPYSLRHFHDLFYSLHPQMEIVNVQKQNADGTTQKLAASDVGNYIRTLALADPAVWQAYKALEAAGGKVYTVGGAVRDALLQKEPKDIDLLVSGIPTAEMAHILNNLPGKLMGNNETPDGIPLSGKDFGVFRYKHKGHEVEIAMPRSEVSTGGRRVDFDVRVDHRMPIENDLMRRDFTVNAMAVDLSNGKLVDPYGGAKDIENRVLRTVHPSSFEEDPTRMVRALVAASRHHLVPNEQTRAEMTQNAHRLDKEARERIQVELDKLFKSDNPAGAVRLAQDTGMLKHIFPEVAHNWDYWQNNKHHNHILGEHLLNVLEGVQDQSTDPDLRLAALLHDIGKPASAWTHCKNCDHKIDGMSEGCPACGSGNTTTHFYRGPNGEGADHALVGADMASDRLRTLKYPNARTKRINHLITHHMFPAFSGPKGARKFLHRVGDEHADDLLTLRYADQRGKGQPDEEVVARTSVDAQRGLVEQARSAQVPTTQSALSVNGNDLLQMGLKPGPDVGRVLRQLTDDVLEQPELNDRQLLMNRAQEYVLAVPA